jgi:hypothetical protein
MHIIALLYAGNNLHKARDGPLLASKRKTFSPGPRCRGFLGGLRPKGETQFARRRKRSALVNLYLR